MIEYGISARQQKYPDEQAFDYKPLREFKGQYQWNEAAKKDVVDYNLFDLSIWS